MWQFWWKLQAFHCTNSIKHLHQPWCCHGTACKIQHPSKISKVFSETGDSIRLCRQHPAATLDFISPRTGKHPFFLACWNWGCDMMEDKTSITNKYIQICTFDFVSPKNMEIRSCWTPFVCFQSVPFSHFFHRICTRGSSGGVLGLSQDHGGWDQDRARDALWSQGRWTLGLSQLS